MAPLPAPVPQQGAEPRLAHSPAPTRAPSPSEEPPRSLRLELPTPAPRRRRSSPIEASRVSERGPAEPSRLEGRPHGDPKIPQYQAVEDLENYLLRFERMARTWGWPETEWACRLVPLLTGKALEAYSAMIEERAHSYPDLKEALRTKFDISPETYRRQFRARAVPPGESPAETYHRLKGLYRRWLCPMQRNKEDIGEQIILEQLLRVFPEDVCTWVKEHEPTDGLAAAKLAQQYVNARRGGLTSFQEGPRRHHPSQLKPSTGASPSLHPAPIQRSAVKDLVCFYCQQAGHKASLCPIRKAKLSGACYTPRMKKVGTMARQQQFKDVFINGERVTALVDSGSLLTLVRRDLVPTGLMDYSQRGQSCLPYCRSDSGGR